jgi:hypothetical protein
VGGFSPQVKQGLIVGAVTLFLGLLGSITGWITTSVENSRLKAKVHDLEIEVQPFRNLAVQEFKKADAQTMKQLAEAMTRFHADYTNQLDTINTLRKHIEELENEAGKNIPRTLTAQEQERFLKLMQNAPKGKVAVWVTMTCGQEIQNYAGQIREMIGKAGYDVGRGLGMIQPTGQMPKGIGIGLKDFNKQPPFAGLLQKSLNEINIVTLPYVDGHTDENTVSIFVGAKL